VRDPLKGWARKDGALAGTFGFQYAPVGGAGLGLEFVQVGQAALQPRSRGAQPAVSIRIAFPSFRYCLIRECLQDTLTRTPPLSRRSIAVRKTPRVSRRILRAKMISTLCGRPMPGLSATSASKKPRAWRGASKTMVREISTCRIEVSHQ